MCVPRSDRRRRWDGSPRSTPESHGLTTGCGQRQYEPLKRHDITGCRSSTRRKGTRRACVQIPFIIALAAASLGSTRAQYEEGGSVSMECEDCSCSGSTDHGTVEVFDNPSSGQRVALVDGTYSEVLETSCGSSIFEVDDTLYELSGVDLVDRVQEVVDMSSNDCTTKNTPSTASCYAGESVVDLSSELEAEITFCVCTWTEGASTSYRTSVSAIVYGTTEVDIPDDGSIFCLRDEFLTQMATIIVEGETDYFNFEVSIPGEDTSADLSVEDAPSSTAESFACGEVEPTPTPVAPTPEPTPKPTPEPTMGSTPSPIDPHTPSPTEPPVVEPTPEPTPELTPEPTPDPTPEVTPDPTPEPVLIMTPEPVADPTPVPIADPTPVPIADPTPVPIADPTPEPTLEPVVETTPEPVVEPTPEPVVEPTPEPVVEPTPEPVVEPTPEPVVEPTPEPTTAATPEPTVGSTPKPTSVATAEPATVPTPVPEPDLEPTSKPTPKPTLVPTLGATFSPVRPPFPTDGPVTPTPLLVATSMPTAVTGGGSPTVAPPSGANNTVPSVAPSSAAEENTATPWPAGVGGNTTEQPGSGLEPSPAPSVADIAPTKTTSPIDTFDIDGLECQLPTGNSCTDLTILSTIKDGVGTYYDLICNTTDTGSALEPGCSPDSSSLCRNCFFNTPLYIENNPDEDIPDYPDCPCCVLEVYGKDIAANENGTRCTTRSPTPSPSASNDVGGAAVLPQIDFKDASRRYKGGGGMALAALVLLAIFTFSPFCVK